MTTFATCKLCGEKISYSPDHIHNYGVHLIEKHPELDFAHFALIYEPTKKGGGGKCLCGCGCEAGSCLRAGKIKHRSHNIKTSVQSWTCSQNPTLCPKCKKTSTPIIKRQRHKLTGSSWVACMLLGCWPFCFLPFIISGSDLFYLYCKECGYYIGMFDRRVSSSNKAVPPCRIPGGPGDPQLCGCH